MVKDMVVVKGVVMVVVEGIVVVEDMVMVAGEIQMNEIKTVGYA